MFDEVTAQRLGRLERGDSQRRWDSAVTTADHRAAAKSSAPTGESPLVDLVTERFDHIERRNERLEWQIVRLEKVTRFWTRSLLGTLGGVVALTLGSILYSVGTRGHSAGDRGSAAGAQVTLTALPAKANSHAPAPGSKVSGADVTQSMTFVGS
jgi:hypothetical protein